MSANQPSSEMVHVTIVPVGPAHQHNLACWRCGVNPAVFFSPEMVFRVCWTCQPKTKRNWWQRRHWKDEVVSANQPSKNAEAGALPINDWLANFNLDTASLVDRLHELERLRAQVAELERAVQAWESEAKRYDGGQIVAEHFARVVTERNASRIEAARLREAIAETMSEDKRGVVDHAAWLHHRNDLDRCPLCTVLAATSESSAAWLAEVQRKALERARARILEVGDAVLPRVRESMGDHPMFSDAGFKTWMAEFVRTMAAVFADAVRDPDLSVDANLDRSLIPEPKEPTP